MSNKQIAMSQRVDLDKNHKLNHKIPDFISLSAGFTCIGFGIYKNTINLSQISSQHS